MQNNGSSKNPIKRYATAAIVLGTGAVLGGSALMSSTTNKNTGTPFSYSGRQYYVQNDSRRVKYPNKEACMADVPVAKQGECEPVNSYRSGATGWYGPLYSPKNPSDTYRPSSQFTSEPATASNFGKKFPSSANTTGFGENGKAFTGSKGS